MNEAVSSQTVPNPPKLGDAKNLRSALLRPMSRNRVPSPFELEFVWRSRPA
jgi:hypothetical protein